MRHSGVDNCPLLRIVSHRTWRIKYSFTYLLTSYGHGSWCYIVEVAEKLIREKLRYAYMQQDENRLRVTLQEINENYEAMSGTTEIEDATTAYRVLRAARSKYL